MDHVFLITSGFLIAFCIVLFLQSKERGKALNEAERQIKEARRREIKTARRLAETARLDSQEIIEIIQEQTATATIESDRWSFEMPYGKWVKFDDTDGAPAPLIRGFWHNMEGRLIGVKMPRGSRYEMHYHDWKETLIGVSGSITVEIEQEGGVIVNKELKADSVIEIPAKVNHAVLKAENDAEFVCVWGLPH